MKTGGEPSKKQPDVSFAKGEYVVLGKEKVLARRFQKGEDGYNEEGKKDDQEEKVIDRGELSGLREGSRCYRFNRRKKVVTCYAHPRRGSRVTKATKRSSAKKVKASAKMSFR